MVTNQLMNIKARKSHAQYFLAKHAYLYSF